MLKKMIRNVTLLTIIMTMLAVAAVPASADTWYTYKPCTTRTVQFSVPRYGSYYIATQRKGKVNMYNSFKRKVDMVCNAYGTYYVTITQIRDAYGRTVNGKICKNRLWASSRLTARLNKGVYQMSVRCLGVLSPAEVLKGIRRVSCWNTYPIWKVG